MMTRLHAWMRLQNASRCPRMGQGIFALCLLVAPLLVASGVQAQGAGQVPVNTNSTGGLPPLVGGASAPPAGTRADSPDASAPANKQTTVKPTPAFEAVPVDYKLSVGDTIQIFVVGHPELSSEATILPDGNIVLPVIRQMNVQGMTIQQVSDRVSRGLRSELSNPRVLTRVVRRAPREAATMGNGVRIPGKRLLGDDYRILQLISESGGLAGDRPEFINAVLFRRGSAIPINVARLLEGDSSQNRLLEDLDVLYIRLVEQQKMTISVLGEVNDPGDKVYPEDGSLQTAINIAKQTKKSAWLSHSKIVRSNGETIPVDLRGLVTTGEIKPDVKLQPGDTVIIPENKLRYTVLGAVARSGEFMYPEDEKVTVLTAISAAGNLAPEADLKKAGIFRKGADGKSVIIPLDLEKLGNPTIKTTKTTKSKSSSKTSSKSTAKTGEDKSGANNGKTTGVSTVKQVATIDTELLPEDQIVIPRKGQRSGFSAQEILYYISAFGVLRGVTR